MAITQNSREPGKHHQRLAILERPLKILHKILRVNSFFFGLTPRLDPKKYDETIQEIFLYNHDKKEL
jgi:hypothetical protein